MAKTAKPNILVIFGDDIGMWNVGVYANGMMGHTPNIDSIGREGMGLSPTITARQPSPVGQPSLWVKCRYGRE